MLTSRRLLEQRFLAIALCAVALLLKLLVPAGYMVGADHGRVTLVACPGVQGAVMAGKQVGMHKHGSPGDHGSAAQPCAFTALSTAFVAAIDPIQPLVPPPLVVATGGGASASPAMSAPTRLRPPLRGPPFTI